MEFVIITLVHFSLLMVESYYDTIVHKSKISTDQKKKERYAQWYHILQLIIYAGIFIYGAYIQKQFGVLTIIMPFIILHYICFRFWLFNSIYNWVNDLARTYLSSTEFFDKWLNKFINFVIRKFSIKHIGLLNMFIILIKFSLFFYSCVLLINHL